VAGLALVAIASLIGIHRASEFDGGKVPFDEINHSCSDVDVPEMESMSSASIESSGDSAVPEGTASFAPLYAGFDVATPEPAFTDIKEEERSSYSRTFEHIDSVTGEQEYLLVEEIERGENYSRVRSQLGLEIALEQVGLLSDFHGDATSEAFLFENYDAVLELACQRDFKFFFVLSGTGQNEFYLFLENSDDMPIEELLGDRYSEMAQMHFDAVGYRRAPSRVAGRRYCLGRPF
jgi:hypothetical protein